MCQSFHIKCMHSDKLFTRWFSHRNFRAHRRHELVFHEKQLRTRRASVPLEKRHFPSLYPHSPTQKLHPGWKRSNKITIIPLPPQVWKLSDGPKTHPETRLIWYISGWKTPTSQRWVILGRRASSPLRVHPLNQFGRDEFWCTRAHKISLSLSHFISERPSETDSSRRRAAALSAHNNK